MAKPPLSKRAALSYQQATASGLTVYRGVEMVAAPSVAGGVHGAQKRLSFLDGWRGIAILTVLAGHFIPGVSPAGSLGVEVFFVLSGRLMAQILVVERYPFPTFFLRRFSRVYPVLLAFIGAMLLGTFATKVLHKVAPFPAPMDALAASTLWLNYRIAFAGASSVLDHLWSICVEEHCYLALAAICALTRRNAKVVTVIVVVLALAAMVNGLRLWGVHPDLHSVYWRTDVRLAPVFLSFGFYLLLHDRARSSGWVPPIAALAGGSLFFLDVPVPLAMTVGSALIALAVNLLDTSAQSVRHALSERVLTQIGIWSFSIYIWQQPVYRLLGKHVWLLPVSLGIILAAALASFYLLENPARRRINQWWAKRQAINDGARIVAAAAS